MYSKYYTEQRMRSFRRRKHISNENRLKALLLAVSVTLLAIVSWQYIFAQHELTQAYVDYSTVAEDAE